ncbi:MAG: selenocysteine-specific translation elongation factor [Acidobacteriota bacterium]
MMSIVVGTAGHIDHGKSALVRALTGTDPDRLKEEQARGITIDLGFAHTVVDGIHFAFVDVPGHERFVKNMLAGAGGIDLVMLIVSAEESVMPQTREHFQICRLLRVPAGIIVLTKADLAEPAMLEISTLETREMVAGSFLDDAPIVAVSSKTGEGLGALRSALVSAAASLRERDPDGPARLPIDRVFSVRGFGTVVTGTLVSGVLREDDELTVLPRNRPVKIRGMQVHGRGEGTASAGQRVAANLGGIELGEVGRGDTLCARGAFEPTRRLDASVDVLPDARALRHGARVRFHHGTSELLGRLAVAAPRNGDGGSVEIAPGRSAFVRIRLEAPAVLTRGDRFILRAYSPSVTIGGGVVLDPGPPRSAIRTAAAAARFRRLDEVEGAQAADDAVLVFMEECAGAGLARARLTSRAGLTAREADATVDRLVRAGRVAVVEDLLVSPAVLQALSIGVIAALRAHHASQPLSEGIPREEVRERLFGRAAPAVFEHVVTALAAEQKIVARERLAVAGHLVSLSPEEADARAVLERMFKEGGLAPPDLSALAASAGMSAALIDRVAKLLLRQKTLVKVDALLFHADVLAQLKADVRGLKGVAGTSGRVDVPAFKERYGITRKFAIPLLEYLDRERVTRRVGDARVVL